MSHERFAGVVSAATPEAARAGAAVLEEGGNAIDAAVATALAVGVTEPAGSGIGGQSTFMVHQPGKDPFVINGTSRSPGTVPADATLADLTGRRASTVPSTLRVLDYAWRSYGSGNISWSRLCEPAVHYAQEGYPLGSFRRKALLRLLKAIRRNGTATKLLLGPDGWVPEVGAIMRSPILGKTLRLIADAGADELYHGAIAHEIHRDMAATGGWITEQDLASVPEPPVLPALAGSYRGWQVHTLPPPAAGWVVLLALNTLERALEGELAVEGPERLLRLTEALVTAHQHNELAPVKDLLHFDDEVTRLTSKSKAKRIVQSLLRGESGETTHLSAADSEGTMVGVTQSLNSYYGAKVASPKLGFLYNDYMREFVTGAEGHPFVLRPGAMPYSSMSATTLSRDGVPALVLGSPGDRRIISAVVQVISHWVDVASGLEAAVAAPRLHTMRGEEVLLEKAPANLEALLKLERRGYSLYQPLGSLFAGDLNPYFGGVHAVAREEDGWTAAADPRRDGQVAFAEEAPRLLPTGPRPPQ